MRLALKSEPCASFLQQVDLHNRPLQRFTCLRTLNCSPIIPSYIIRNQPMAVQSSSFASLLGSSSRRREQQALPLDRSWGGELPDWELEPYDSDEEIEDELEASVLSPESGGGGGGEFAFQNVLAAVLLGALALSFGNLILKLGVVVFALVSAAFRYTSIAFLTIVILALLS